MRDAILFFYPSTTYLPDRVKSGSVLVREVADNNYKTFSDRTSYAIKTHRQAMPTKMTHLCVKTKGVDSYEVQGSFNRTMPSNTSRFGFQQDLFEFPETLYDEDLSVEFTGTDVAIYEIMVLELALFFHEDKRFVAERHTKVNATGGTHISTEGEATGYRRRGAHRWYWRSDYSCIFEADAYDTFLLWLSENPVVVFCPGIQRFPNRVYPASHIKNEYAAVPRSSVQSAGSLLDFTMAEYTGKHSVQVTSQNNDPPDVTQAPPDAPPRDGMKIYLFGNKTYIIDRKVFGINVPANGDSEE